MLDLYQARLCEENPWDFSDLQAVIINCTLKPSPAPSNTQGLLDRAMAIFKGTGVAVDEIRAVDHDLPPGVYPDMRDHGFETDEWPVLFERVMAANIVVIGTPI